MALAIYRKAYGYSKVEKEDPEDIKHRRAQFLIYKVMEKADHGYYYSRRRKPKSSSSSSWSLRIRISKLKVKIGKRLRRFKKRIQSTVSSAKSGFHGHLMAHLKTVKNIISLPPLFK
ncbi:uncharacterized protein LOC114720364 [Neltuma alba]|uniref:uncharacterized protein LOC114720364 n=1 Tax=Neltuma alba TaxID=207710 RepID=UPI0010A3A540|nr:uncharacterized protein LOC114720364 [Prosopis alba]